VWEDPVRIMAGAMEKVTSAYVKRVARVSQSNSEIKEIVASSIGACGSTPRAKIRRLQKVQHISETFYQQVVRQRLLLTDWRLSRTKQPLWCTLWRPKPPECSRQRGALYVIWTRHAGSFRTGMPATIRYDTRCYFNVRSKANMSQLNLPHGTDN